MLEGEVEAQRLIHLQKISVRLGATEVLNDFELAVAEGELVALVGPSGSGKTTALRAVNGLIKPYAGQVSVAGRALDQWEDVELRRRIGYVIQDAGLFPHWTVRQNVACVLRLLGWSAEQRTARVSELAAQVGLGPELLGRRPAALSGGQRQRVGIARALAAGPQVLLMDEPFGAVDPLTRVRLRTLMSELRASKPTTTLLVTHDLEDALRLADKVAVLRDGALVQLDTPEQLLERPADPWVQEFLAAGTRMTSQVAG